MSPKSLSWQDRTLRAAMTVGCLSSVQFAGCLNNPTRTDLAAEAGKAALIAEEDITHQKTQEAIAAAHSEQPSARDHESRDHESPPAARGNVVLAAGEFLPGQDDSPILQTSGEEPQAEAPEKKKSFWNFWPRKSSKPVVKDPFANHPELKSATKPQDQNPSVGKAKLATTAAAPVPDRKPAEKDPFSAENWFEKELAKQPVPSWAQIDQQGTGIGEGVAVAFQNSPEEKSPVEQARLSKPAASAADTAPWAAQPESKLKSAPVRPASPWDAVATTPPSRSQLKNVASGTQTPSSESVVVRQQKLRIQALLSDAHSNAQRGELHNAYRSALLAEKIASDYKLTFAEEEEHPQMLSRNLAAKLWQTSNVSEEAYLAAADLHAPTANQQIRNPAAPVNEPNSGSANTSFPGGTFATWQPLPEPAGQRPRAVASTVTPSTNHQAPARSTASQMNSMPQGAMPQIRPWVNERTVQGTTPPEAFSNSNASQPTLGLTAPELAQEGDAGRHSQSRHLSDTSGSGVQFAIAHEVHENQPPKLLDPFVASGSNVAGNVTDPSDRLSNNSMSSVALDRPRTMLMAPPTPAETGSRATADSSLTWEQISRADSGEGAAQIKADHDTQVIRRVIWSMIGLLGAAITTGIGIWYSKRKETELPVAAAEEKTQTEIATETSATPASTILEMVTDPAPAQDEQEVQPLQFKRAA